MKYEPSVTRKFGDVSLTEHLRAPLNFLGILSMSPLASMMDERRIWKAERPFVGNPTALFDELVILAVLKPRLSIYFALNIFQKFNYNCLNMRGFGVYFIIIQF